MIECEALHPMMKILGSCVFLHVQNVVDEGIEQLFVKAGMSPSVMINLEGVKIAGLAIFSNVPGVRAKRFLDERPTGAPPWVGDPRSPDAR